MNIKFTIIYLVSLLIFGMNGVVASFIPLSSSEIIFLRTFLGALTLAVTFLILRKKVTLLTQRRDLVLLILSGIALGTSWIFLFEAYRESGVSIATLIYYCGPIIVMAVSPLFFREKFTLPKVVGFVIVAGGCLFLNAGAVLEGLGGFGLVCSALSAVLYAVLVICSKKATRTGGLENTLLQLVVACVVVAVFVGFTGGFSFLTEIQPDAWIWILILGVVNTGIGCLFYFSSIGKIPVQSVSVLGYLEPLSAVIFSVLFLQEILSPLQIVGAACIIGGAVIAEISWKKRSKKSGGTDA